MILLRTVVVYYVVGYLLIGGVLVRWLGVLSWSEMACAVIGCLVGHYVGRSDTMRAS